MNKASQIFGVPYFIGKRDSTKFHNEVDRNGGCETTAGDTRTWETPQEQRAEEAPGPPAESERPQWKGTIDIHPLPQNY
ncbi:hypothetical protein LJR015_003416 [Peribacillus frigoritolerans]|uniref:hypothetical protein n=1 Tax=Peribacillus frigoritolerans TaxID=450367 RepID=UPI003ED126F8